MEVRILLPELMNANTDNFGEQIYVNAAFPNGLTIREFHALTERQRREHTWWPAVRGWAETVPKAPLKKTKTRAGD
jgi:hypothetical protein